MKKLNYEWKNITPYNIRVQRRNPVTSQPVRMALQLYQVDPKSYLLDFKSLVDAGPEVVAVKERHSSSTDSNPSRSNSVSSSDSAFFRCSIKAVFWTGVFHCLRNTIQPLPYTNNWDKTNLYFSTMMEPLPRP